jgi:chromosome segregation ATPase
MFNVKISVPTYQANSWGQLDKQGEVQISADVDSLSQEYPVMKAQIDELLKEANAENRLVLDLKELERKCENKQRSLDILQDKINIARQQLRRLETFLKRLGIDPTSYTLIVDEKVALRAATTDDSGEVVAVEAEVDSIPFERSTDEQSHEF